MTTERASYEAAIEKGDALAWQGRWEESLGFFRQALAGSPDDILAHSSLGAAYSHLGRFGEALEEYRQVLRALPKDVFALARTADCCARLGRMEECASAYLSLGDEYMDQKNYLQAVASWRKLVSLLPQHQQARAKLAEALDRGGDVEEAAEQFVALAGIVAKQDAEQAAKMAARALELDPDNVEAKRLLAALEEVRAALAQPAAQQPVEEVVTAGEALQESPIKDDLPSEPLFIESREREAREVEAVEEAAQTPTLVASAAVSLAPAEELDEAETRFDAVLHSSEMLVAQGLNLAAIDECYQFIGSDPDFLPIHIRNGEIQQSMGRIEEAIAKFSTVAEVYLIRGNVDEAIEVYGKVVALCSDDSQRRLDFIRLLTEHGKHDEIAEQHLLLAERRVRARQFDAALVDYKEAIRLAPQNARAHFGFGQVLWQMGFRVDALRELRQALSLDPSNAEIALRLSITLALSGAIEEGRAVATELLEKAEKSPPAIERAAREYQTLADEHPEVPSFSAWTGILLYRAGRPAEATPYLERAVEKGFGDELTQSSLSRCYLAQSMHVRALVLLDQLPEERRAEFKPALKEEASRLGKEGNWGKSVVLLETLKKWDPNAEESYMKLAEAYFRQGAVAKAVQEFDSLGKFYLSREERKRAAAIFTVIKQMAPQTPVSYLRLGDLHASENKKKEAAAEYEALADLQLKQGQTSDAMATLQKVVELDPTRIRGNLLLGETLFAAKEFAQAASVFRRVLGLDPNNAIARSRLAAINNRSAS